MVVHRLDVDVVVGLVVHRGHVRETREVGRRGRGGVAVRWQEKRRLWKPWAGDDAGDAFLGGDRDGTHSERLERAPHPPVGSACADERVDESLCWRVPFGARRSDRTT